jgi:hypothetical protein
MEPRGEVRRWRSGRDRSREAVTHDLVELHVLLDDGAAAAADEQQCEVAHDPVRPGAV